MDGTEHGFRFSDGSFQTLDFPGASGTRLGDIDDSGEIVVWYWDDSGQHSFVDRGGTRTILDIPGTAKPFATGISRDGTIVGYADNGMSFIATPVPDAP